MKIQLTRLQDARTSDVLYFPIVESLALGYLARYLRKNSFQAEIIDEEASGLSREETIRKLERNDDLIAFTAIAKPQIFSILEVIQELKNKGSKAHFTIGGQYATFLFKDLLSLEERFDSVICYEGEETIVELAEALENSKDIEKIRGLAFKQGSKIKQNPIRPLIHDLDGMPFPARDTLSNIIEKGGLPVISSSRGCYNRCSYCTISQFYNDPPGPNFRYRSAESVLEEIEGLKEQFPSLSDIWFVDDNFVMPGKQGLQRTKKLCKGLKKIGLEFDIYLRANDVNKQLLKLLKESGIRSIFIGAEAGSNFTLQKIFNKNISVEQTKKAIQLCNEAKISVDPGFIMFHPWSTLEEIEANIQFLEEIKQYSLYGIVSFLTAYKFTPIGKQMLSGERIYKKPHTKIKKILDDAIEYEIADAKTEILLCLTLKAFQEFRELPALLSQLKAGIRNLKKAGLEEQSTKLDKEWAKRMNEINYTGLQFFKQLLKLMKENELREELIKPEFENILKKIQEYSKKEKELISHQIGSSQLSPELLAAQTA
ncbi:MAG: radical SAM protein [archaeon]